MVKKLLINRHMVKKLLTYRHVVNFMRSLFSDDAGGRGVVKMYRAGAFSE
jgi:hypothetical protein